MHFYINYFSKYKGFMTEGNPIIRNSLPRWTTPTGREYMNLSEKNKPLCHN